MHEIITCFETKSLQNWKSVVLVPCGWHKFGHIIQTWHELFFLFKFFPSDWQLLYWSLPREAEFTELVFLYGNIPLSSSQLIQEGFAIKYTTLGFSPMSRSSLKIPSTSIYYLCMALVSDSITLYFLLQLWHWDRS